MARVAVAHVPVMAFKKLEGGILMQAKRPSAELRPPKVRGDTPAGQL